MKLTASMIDSLSCPTGKNDATYFDDITKGFGLRCRSSGVRRWVVMYENSSGQTRRITIGAPDVLSLDKARAVARKLLAEKALGGDPAAKKMEARQAAKHTLGSVIDSYLEQCETRLRPSTMRHLNRYLRDWWRPLANVPVNKLTRQDIAPYLTGPSVAAARARSRLMTCCRWAMEQGWLDANPTIGTGVPDRHIRPRERVLSAQELISIWNACDGGYAYDTIVRLLIVTGARRSEVGDLRWHELNRGAGTWTIPADRAKSGRDHVLPLPPLAWELIDAWAERGAGADWLFFSRGFQAWSQCKRALDARCGVESWVLHDIRRSVATHAADMGVAPHTVEAVLGHQYGSRVSRTYNRSAYFNDMRVALNLWADHLQSIVSGGERKIIALRQ
jgi:integrase